VFTVSCEELAKLFEENPSGLRELAKKAGVDMKSVDTLEELVAAFRHSAL